MNGDAWRLDAACRHRPTSWWFASDSFSMQVALTVCRGCPVRLDCLDDALANEGGDHLAFGVRGGLRADQRIEILRHRPAEVAAVTVELVAVGV